MHNVMKKTSNVLVTLLQLDQNCFEELCKAVKITCQICEFIWQWVPDRWTSNHITDHHTTSFKLHSKKTSRSFILWKAGICEL